MSNFSRVFQKLMVFSVLGLVPSPSLPPASFASFTLMPGRTMLLAPPHSPAVLEVDDLDATDRGAGGFGSTGVQQPLASKENTEPSA